MKTVWFLLRSVGPAAVLSALFLLAGGVYVVGRGARSGDVAWFVVLFAIAAFMWVRRYRQRKRAVEDKEMEVLFEAARERQNEKKRRTTGPVTGKKCVACGDKIVVDFDGTRCGDCGAPVHNKCEKGHRGEAHTVAVGTYR
jgi:hypothetical protein